MSSWAFLVDSVPFTKATRDGLTSLGGSESACLGLARALSRRGHRVHVFATRLDDDAAGVDGDGVTWHHADEFAQINLWIEWDVAVALRMFQWFAVGQIRARLRVLWNQDLLLPDAAAGVMSVAWALDQAVYVSEYHRQQWEDLQPELASIGWVTKNGYDPAHVPVGRTKDSKRILHISRPERGLAPLLRMWPAIKAARPDAELRICRYASMYDGEGGTVKAVCESFDDAVARVNAEVGGITYLGSLNKADLYREIADAAVMWYPGVAGFAETSCIAAVESLANGTPFVASLKGALPETAKSSYDAGLLIPGDAMTPEYQKQSVAAVLGLLDGCAKQTRTYRDLQNAGLEHVKSYTYDALAAEWEHHIEDSFETRYEQNKLRILRRLLHEDDHCAAKVVATQIVDQHIAEDRWLMLPPGYGEKGVRLPEAEEAFVANEFCDRVIAGKEQGPEDYAAHAIQDPLEEVEKCGRFKSLNPLFKDCTRVLDIACGNGSFAIGLALAHPNLHVDGFDYAAQNIASATDAAQRAGVADRCHFYASPVWNFAIAAPDPGAAALVGQIREHVGGWDGCFVGEFAEHIADVTTLVDFVDGFLNDGAKVIYTTPSGPFVELAARGAYIQRGHVHHYKYDDVEAVWGQKLNFRTDYFDIGITNRGAPIGHWFIQYTKQDGHPTGRRDLVTRAKRTRPQNKLSVGMIVKDAEFDLGKCLNSVWGIADEIVIGDTGSKDLTKDVAALFNAKVIDLASIQDQPEGFAGARNQVLAAATGDWFLWLDADETLVDAHLLHRYLDGAIYNGFVIHQTHLYLDMAPTFDIPVRLFRTSAPIKFYGCVHEQPQMGNCNGDIQPTLEPYDVMLAHTGYLTEGIRRDKMLKRNLPLLMRDQTVFPDRTLGKVLVMRDYVNLSDMEREQTGGRLTARARSGYAQALRLFIDNFDDPTHKYHQIARPSYETALQRLNLGWEMEVAAAGKSGGLGAKRAERERFWVRDAAEFMRLQAHRCEKVANGMAGGPVLKTDPFVLPVRDEVPA